MSRPVPPSVPAVAPVLAWPDRRALVLLAIMLVWSGVLVARLGRLMVFPDPELKAAVTRAAWFHGEIPSPRGCLLDRDGRLLAWSSRHFALRWRVPTDPRHRGDDWRRIRHYLAPPEPRVPWPPGAEVTILSDLSANELAAAGLLCETVPRLRLEAWSARHRATTDTALAAYLGEVRLVDGRETGVTGAEMAHDAVLRGVPGRFQVMLDRHGRWLRDTWKKDCDMVPGYDVYLPIRMPQTLNRPRPANAN